MPAEIFLLWLFLAVYDNFHSHFIETVLFILIEDIKFYFMIFYSVWYFKEEPLWVAIGIDIILK